MAGRVFLPLYPSCCRWLVNRQLTCSLHSLGHVLVVHKTSRLEHERMKNKALSDQELKKKLLSHGSDYDNLLTRHTVHNNSLGEIESFLQSHAAGTRFRNRETYSSDDVQWADTILSAGGDGNFLFTASKVLSTEKLVIGLNTDPTWSEGHLCLKATPTIHQTTPTARQTTPTSLTKVLEGVLKRDFPKIQRQRIRVNVADVVLPVRALNEVFVGEKDHSHASYYQLSYDGSVPEKQKSSGLLIYTGTGSTSWAFNVNKFTGSEVSRILQTAERQGVTLTLPPGSTLKELSTRISEEYNWSNVFSGEEEKMAFVSREPIIRGIFAACETHGYARESVVVRSRSWYSRLVIDGHFCHDFHHGSTAICQLHCEDLLTTLSNTS